MRHTTSWLLGSALMLSAGAPAMGSADPPYTERERIHRSFSLASGSRIDISMIAGPVEIDTTGGRSVEVEAVRSAPTQRDSECGSLVIEQTGSTLTIRSVPRCPNVRISETVKLIVPRDVDLSLRNIAGHVRIGSTDGMVRLESIAGHVALAGLREGRLISLARGLALTVSDLSDRGIHVSSVTGGIDLDVGSRADAEVVIRSIAGRIDNDVPGVRIAESDETNYRAVIGSGRGKIDIESVVGTVRIHS